MISLLEAFTYQERMDFNEFDGNSLLYNIEKIKHLNRKGLNTVIKKKPKF